MSDLLRKWRRARLNRGQNVLGYPKTNILHPEHGIGDEDPPNDPDVEVFQRMVERLTPELRAAFEAFHLGILHGTYCRSAPHRMRAFILGVDKKTYRTREKVAREKIKRDLLTVFEKVGKILRA
jgi:DNA-directed RNA polymerase specialized sigma24 family protein